MLTAVSSATLLGVWGHPVSVEAHVADGLAGFTISGLGDGACKRALDRIRAAVVSSGLRWPTQRITVNLATGDAPKSGAGLDLAVAVAVLAADGQITPEAVAGIGMIGELGLDGSIRAVPGVVPLVEAINESPVVVAAQDHTAAQLVAAGGVRPAGTLREVCDALAGTASWPDPPPERTAARLDPEPDLVDVAGRPQALRALEIAAAGRHHLLLIGRPGSGKTMLARRLVGLLPDLTPDEALEVTRIHSAAGLAGGGRPNRRPPFRAPHHTTSMAALMGGRTPQIRPGEVSIATGGVLHLDGLEKFPSSVLDAMSQTLDDGIIRIARSRGLVEHPARFLLVAAMNRCLCAACVPEDCSCAAEALARYQRRLSGPFVDRLDLIVNLDRGDPAALLDDTPRVRSAEIAERVKTARERAEHRTADHSPDASTPDDTSLTDGAVDVLRGAVKQGLLSPRGLRRVRAVARTIRDLDDGGSALRAADVDEALSLRAPGHAAPRRA